MKKAGLCGYLLVSSNDSLKEEKLADGSAEHNVVEKRHESSNDKKQSNNAVEDIINQVVMSIPPFNVVFGIRDLAEAARHHRANENKETRKELILSAIGLVPYGGRFVVRLLRKQSEYENIVYLVTVDGIQTLNSIYVKSIPINVEGFLRELTDEKVISDAVIAVKEQIKKASTTQQSMIEESFKDTLNKSTNVV